jgi:hypothetical protein
VVIQLGSDRLRPPLICDTLTIDTEIQELSLVFRTSLNVQGRVSKLRWIKVEESAGG